MAFFLPEILNTTLLLLSLSFIWLASASSHCSLLPQISSSSFCPCPLAPNRFHFTAFSKSFESEQEEEEEQSNTKKKIVIRVVFGERKKTEKVSESSMQRCRADECGVDLRMANKYHQKHKVCDRHSKASVVLVCGIRQRFCQQCSKFHELSQSDDTKRSCRERLASHNERRRKTHTEQMPHSSQMMK